MIKKIYILLTVMLAVIGTRQVQAQGIAIKTNFAGWAALAGNIGAEFCVSECSSVEVSFYKSIADCYIKMLISQLFSLDISIGSVVLR